MRSRVSGLTLSLPFNASDTVFSETPVAFAIVRMDTTGRARSWTDGGIANMNVHILTTVNLAAIIASADMEAHLEKS